MLHTRVKLQAKRERLLRYDPGADPIVRADSILEHANPVQICPEIFYNQTQLEEA